MNPTFTDQTSHGSFTLEHTFDHPVQRVWRAWSDVSIKKRWFHGGDTWKETERTLDFRIGGQDIVTGHFSATGASRYVATYHDIELEERIILVYDMWIDGKYLSTSLATLLFRSSNEQTHLTMTEQGIYFDGPKHNENRKQGTADQFERITAAIADLD